MYSCRPAPIIPGSALVHSLHWYTAASRLVACGKVREATSRWKESPFTQVQNANPCRGRCRGNDGLPTHDLSDLAHKAKDIPSCPKLLLRQASTEEKTRKTHRVQRVDKSIGTQHTGTPKSQPGLGILPYRSGREKNGSLNAAAPLRVLCFRLLSASARARGQVRQLRDNKYSIVRHNTARRRCLLSY